MASVWYIGTAGTRIITVADWAGLGLTVAVDTKWIASNGWSIPRADMSEGQILVLAADADMWTTAPDGPRIWGQVPGAPGGEGPNPGDSPVGKMLQILADALALHAHIEADATEVEADRAATAILKEAARLSAEAAGISDTNAEASEGQALAWAGAAGQYATNADNSADAAQIAETNAEAAEIGAVTARNQAQGFATTAGTKATEAEQSNANAFLAQKAAELARDQAIGGILPDGYVTKAKLDTPLKGSIDKAESAVQGTDARLSDTRVPKAHSHDALDITSGLLPVARGGTGTNTHAPSSYLRGNGGGILQSDSYATVRTNIGAAPTVHTHAEGDITGLTAKLATKQDAAQAQAIAVAAIANWVGATPGALDTLQELAAALGNNPNFATDVMAAIGLRALTTDARFTDARTPLGATQATWNAGTANTTNYGLTPAELRAAVIVAIGLTDPKAHTHTTAQVSGLDAFIAATNSGLSGKVKGTRADTELWFGTQGEFDALAAGVKNRFGFVAVIG